MEPKILLNASEIVKDNTMEKNYAVDIMRFNLLWQKGYTGKGITIGIVDTGIDYNHMMFKDKIICGQNFSDDGNPENDIYDYNSHGTSVSALACGLYMNYKIYGVATDAKIVVAKSMNVAGKGSIQSIVNGINYCVENNVDIINCSIGISSNSDLLEKTVRNAVSKGISVVVACGNDGSGDTDGGIREVSYPGAYDDSICVGAMDKEYNITYFSNSNEYVDIVAPGYNLLTAYPNNSYGYVQGTSFSTPLISGCLALLKQKFMEEFKRVPSETELYGQLMKYVRELKDVDRQMQGNGYIDFSINRRKRR